VLLWISKKLRTFRWDLDYPANLEGSIVQGLDISGTTTTANDRAWKCTGQLKRKHQFFDSHTEKYNTGDEASSSVPGMRQLDAA
jgi:hypothetical protein